MKGERIMRRNIYKTRTYCATFVQNIDKSASVYSSIVAFSARQLDVIKLACTRLKGWMEEAPIKRPTKNRTPKLFE